MMTWREFFNGVKVHVVGEIISKIDGDEGITSYDPLEVVLVGLDRDPRITPVLKDFAKLLLKRLGV